MGDKMTSAVWEHSRQAGSRRLLLLAIANHADDDGLAWPGLKLLERKTKVALRTVQRNNRICCDAGEMIRFSQADIGKKCFSLLLHGLTIGNLRSAIARLQNLAGNDILARAYPEAWIPFLQWLSHQGKSPLDKMTIPLDILAQGDDIAMSLGVDIAMSTESSRILMNQELNNSGAEAPPSTEEEEAEDFIGESRIPKDLQPLDLDQLSQQQRAAIATPTPEHPPPDKSEPDWKRLIRLAPGRRKPYPEGYYADDVLAICERISLLGGIEPPATLQQARAWHAGATTLLHQFDGQINNSGYFAPGPAHAMRMMMWCIDLFFYDDGPFGFITALSPHSLINSTGKLVGELRAMLAHYDMSVNLLPDREQIAAYYRHEEKGEGPNDTRRIAIGDELEVIKQRLRGTVAPPARPG